MSFRLIARKWIREAVEKLNVERKVERLESENKRAIEIITEIYLNNEYHDGSVPKFLKDVGVLDWRGYVIKSRG